MSTRLFYADWDDVDHAAIDYAHARDFIRAERNALADLPPLAEGTTLSRPVPYELRVTNCLATLRSDGGRVATVARGDKCDDGDVSLLDGSIHRVAVSPDGRRAVVLANLHDGYLFTTSTSTTSWWFRRDRPTWIGLTIHEDGECVASLSPTQSTVTIPMGG